MSITIATFDEGGQRLGMTTQISSSDIVKYNRMDPRFFIAIAPFRTLIEDYEEIYSNEEAQAILGMLDLERLKDRLTPLSIASDSASVKNKLRSVVKHYPIVMLAAVTYYADESMRKIQESIDELDGQVDLLREQSDRFAALHHTKGKRMTPK